MNLSVGIVGLPNVGKSTLFNALLKRQQAMVANYPFATIEPNIGIIPVPDERLEKLADIIAEEDSIASLQNDKKRPPIIPATVKFVDIAGLVKGAASGAGLGNKFLANIREVDLIAQVIRAFPDPNIIREGSTDPKSDIEIINTELILADLQTVEKALDSKGNRGSKDTEIILNKLRKALNAGTLARDIDINEEELETVKALQLLTMKQMVYILNVNSITDWKDLEGLGKSLGIGGRIAVIDAKLEADLAELSPEEQKEYLISLGIQDSGVNQLIRKVYGLLGLISFLTAGVKEVRAWTIKKGTKGPAAAGTIHTDFEKGYIKAEVVNYQDFIENFGWKKCRELGKVRFEGKEYIVKDGDVIEFKVNT